MTVLLTSLACKPSAAGRLYVSVPGGVLEHMLRAAKEIAARTLAAQGFVLRDPEAMVYNLRIEEKPERLYITIEQPVVGLIVGSWSAPGVCLFQLVTIDPTQAGAQWPFSVPSFAAARAGLPQRSDILHVDLAQLLPPPRQATERQLRVIELD